MNTLVLIYAVSFTVAVLLSDRFWRGILSASVLFLVAGILTALFAFGSVSLAPTGPLDSVLAEVALFTDGRQLAFRETDGWCSRRGRSIVVHSSTDVPIARWLESRSSEAPAAQSRAS